MHITLIYIMHWQKCGLTASTSISAHQTINEMAADAQVTIWKIMVEL